MVDFIDKTSGQNGTPINRANLMAIQGFQSSNIKITDNLITELYSDGSVLTVETKEELTKSIIIETFKPANGEKILKKEIQITSPENIKESVS